LAPIRLSLEEAGFRPDWVSGISIGAINAAILVGNEPDQRLTQLEELNSRALCNSLPGILKNVYEQ
jgi:NTE family protein